MSLLLVTNIKKVIHLSKIPCLHLSLMCILVVDKVRVGLLEEEVVLRVLGDIKRRDLYSLGAYD